MSLPPCNASLYPSRSLLFIKFKKGVLDLEAQFCKNGNHRVFLFLQFSLICILYATSLFGSSYLYIRMYK